MTNKLYLFAGKAYQKINNKLVAEFLIPNELKVRDLENWTPEADDISIIELKNYAYFALAKERGVTIESERHFKITYRYVISQGKMDASGCGCCEEFSRFENLTDAIKYFNKIKNDIKGYDLHKNQYLLTTLEKCYFINGQWITDIDTETILRAYEKHV